MNDFKLDITGKMCPFCLLLVKKKLAQMDKNDILVVLCDHPPAATETIPYSMEKMNYPLESKKIESGLWELKIIKQ